MLAYNKNLPLFSIHIPKTGGTSFDELLRVWFGKYLYYHYYNEKKGIPPKTHPLTSKKRFIPFIKTPEICVHGHFNNKRGTGLIDYYPEAKQCISIVRDPLDTALSNFFFVKRKFEKGDAYRDGKLHTTGAESIDEYVEKSNSYIPAFMPVPVNESNYQEAINQYYIHIGIMENYQKSIDIIAKKLNKKTIQVPHKNETPRNLSPSVEATRKFKERNKLAYLIYEYIVQLNE